MYNGWRDLPKKVAEKISAGGVTLVSLRKTKHGVNSVIPDVTQRGRLASLDHQRV
jgi:hypothetical protein